MSNARDICIHMFSEFCATMSERGFRNEDIIHALELSVEGMKAVPDMGTFHEQLDEMLTRLGFVKVGAGRFQK